MPGLVLKLYSFLMPIIFYKAYYLITHNFRDDKMEAYVLSRATHCLPVLETKKSDFKTQIPNQYSALPA